MDVLTVRADHASRVVPKQELIDAVWSREHLAESVLTRAVAELRGVLRDDAHAPRHIETIPKRGHRLIALVATASHREGWEPAPNLVPMHRPGARWLLAAAAGAALGAVLLWLVANLPPAAGPTPLGGARKVALGVTPGRAMPIAVASIRGIGDGADRAASSAPGAPYDLASRGGRRSAVNDRLCAPVRRRPTTAGARTSGALFRPGRNWAGTGSRKTFGVDLTPPRAA